MSAAGVLPGLSVGLIFTAIGVLKFTGLHLGLRGGRGVPLPQRMVGTCPTWTSKWLRLGMPALFLAMLLPLILRGPGGLSVDAAIARRLMPGAGKPRGRKT